MAIDESKAKIVQEIFEMRAAGYSLGVIVDCLYKKGVPSPRRNVHWSRETIRKLLRNEKYTGDVLLQKTFVEDLFSGKQKKNIGQFEKFLVQEHHPAIICSSKQSFPIAHNIANVHRSSTSMMPFSR